LACGLCFSITSHTEQQKSAKNFLSPPALAIFIALMNKTMTESMNEESHETAKLAVEKIE
jgi:hypothetical protein